jgi:hypothetical protein
MERGSRDLILSGAESASGESDTKDKDIASGHESAIKQQEEQSDSYTTSVPRTSPRGAKDSGRRRKNSNPISYSDLSYLNSLSRQERRRIEGEIIKGRKVGKCLKISHMTIDHVLAIAGNIRGETSRGMLNQCGWGMPKFRGENFRGWLPRKFPTIIIWYKAKPQSLRPLAHQNL